LAQKHRQRASCEEGRWKTGKEKITASEFSGREQWKGKKGENSKEVEAREMCLRALEL
jgi:hypothetical protein